MKLDVVQVVDEAIHEGSEIWPRDHRNGPVDVSMPPLVWTCHKLLLAGI